MEERASWVPLDVDTTVPSAARLYDFLLGGGHNFPADRALAEKFLLAQPNAKTIARLNRAFLRRAVLYMMAQGVDQFLDLGSGIPTVGNVHEIAHHENPDSRVVYVDFEAIAVAHTEIMLTDVEGATVVRADMTEPQVVLDAARRTGLLDFDRPIGVLTVGVFHFVPPEKNPGRILATYRDAVPAGSYLAVSQFTADLQPVEMAGIVEVMKKSMNPMFPRSAAEITAFFDGFDIIDPGVVPVPLWRPDSTAAEDPNKAGILAGVGRKK